ncbi:alpha-L-arabinofuranosidase C-terminal domain-containing protein [Streptomyces rimosus]|uniref:alpha-L-arabinofuranosidase C-terminal domain-containing protein n=1 Tax=Streptomyces rimosus TaxID=1927 RepID=UPI0004C8B0D9|nr:alpha-L-arabinofuranosidase C-terminal domain-containing protein [Streptomyces rimosus]
MASDDQRPGAVPGGPGRRTVIAALGATALTEALRTGAAPPAAAAPGPALPAPVAHWAFEEGRGSTAADSSGHGRTLTLRGGAAWGDGHTGHGLALAGRACATATGPAVDTEHGFTLTARVRLTATDGFRTAVALDGAAVSACYLQLRDDTRAFAFTRLPRDAADANGAAVIAGAGFAPEAGRWYHLAGVADAAAGVLRLYVDGVLEGEVPAPGGWRATGATTVGRGLFGGAEADHFQGGIDDVRCYDTALSGAQIARLAGVPERDTTPLLTIDARRPGPTVPPRLGGIFFEDINHSGEGGLYAELVNNRSFMADPRTPLHWSALGGATIALDPTAPLNEALTRSLRITVRGPGSGTANDGYWGIPVRPATTYRASYYAKADGRTGPLTLALTGTDGTVHARAAAPAPGRDWRRYDLTLRTPPTAPRTTDARLTLTTAGTTGTTGTLWLSQVSLFPPTHRDRPNGLRPDLMAALAALRPAFLRFPGGNYLEGNVIADRFDWKQTIGPVERRPGHRNSAWGYWSTDGLGLPEYLQMAEDLDCEPVLCVYAGYSLKGEHVTGEALRPFVQDALDQVEYITGPATSPWGARRAADGHPAPHPLRYVEIGNEDWFDTSGSYEERYAAFHDALTRAYPHLKLIATTPVRSRPYDLIDEHYYRSPAAFAAGSHLYDRRDRATPKVFVGEWAAQEGRPTPNLRAALGDAAWLTGIVRNSDHVVMECYAPLFSHVRDNTWATNLIAYDGLTSYHSPSSYAQQLLRTHRGDTVLPTGARALPGLSTVTTRDHRTGRLYLAVVNTGGAPRTTPVRIDGVRTIGPAGRAEILSGPGPEATNTLSDPTAVVPRSVPVNGLGTRFTYTFPAYSVTVLRLYGG